MPPRAVAPPGPGRRHMGILFHLYASLVLACFCKSARSIALFLDIVQGSFRVFFYFCCRFSFFFFAHACVVFISPRRLPRTLRWRCILHRTSLPDSLKARWPRVAACPRKRHTHTRVLPTRPRPRRRHHTHAPRAYAMHASAPYTPGFPSPALNQMRTHAQPAMHRHTSESTANGENKHKEQCR